MAAGVRVGESDLRRFEFNGEVPAVFSEALGCMYVSRTGDVVVQGVMVYVAQRSGRSAGRQLALADPSEALPLTRPPRAQIFLGGGKSSGV